MSAITEIYYGNLSGYDIKMPCEWHILLKKLDTIDEKLENNLTSEQKELLDKARCVMMEMTGIERTEMFETAFKIGVSIGYESRTVSKK